MYGYNSISYESFKETFSSNLAIQMELKGYTPYKLSKICDIPRNSLTRYLKGEIMPSVQSLINLTYVLKCDLSDLIPVNNYIEK